MTVSNPRRRRRKARVKTPPLGLGPSGNARERAARQEGYQAGHDAGYQQGIDAGQAEAIARARRMIARILIAEIYRPGREDLRGQRNHLVEDARFWGELMDAPQREFIEAHRDTVHFDVFGGGS